MMDSTGHVYEKYLDVRVLSRIRALELRARMIVEGYFSGMHRSPYRGAAVEYADHRQYVQGDDVRFIDWKVFGRTDKYYIKEFEQETNLDCLLMVDCSESMRFRSAGSAMSKYEYAISLAAALAYLSLQQQDSVGVALFDDQITHFVRPSSHSTQWKTIIHELEDRTTPSGTDVQTVCESLVKRLSRRMLVFMISDLFDEPEHVMRGIKALRYHRHELIVCQLWDRIELSFDLAGPTMFMGLEDRGRLMAEPRALRARYLAEVERFQQMLRRECSRLHVDYVSFDTSAPLDTALSAYLGSRAARIRRRSSRVISRG